MCRNYGLHHYALTKLDMQKLHPGPCMNTSHTFHLMHTIMRDHLIGMWCSEIHHTMIV